PYPSVTDAAVRQLTQGEEQTLDASLSPAKTRSCSLLLLSMVDTHDIAHNNGKVWSSGAQALTRPELLQGQPQVAHVDEQVAGGIKYKTERPDPPAWLDAGSPATGCPAVD
ncbi:hypothetical protein Vretimale_19822, partial [Volvox reticuliferus]